MFSDGNLIYRIIRYERSTWYNRLFNERTKFLSCISGDLFLQQNYIYFRSKKMSDTPNDNKKDVDISSAMDKIVEDTIGHIPVSTPTSIKAIKKDTGDNKKTVNKSNNTVKLPSKKKVTLDEKIEAKASRKTTQSKREVDLFFPNFKVVTPESQDEQVNDRQQQGKQQLKKQQPKKTKPQQSKKANQQQPKELKAQQSKKGNQQQPKELKSQQPQKDKQQPKKAKTQQSEKGNQQQIKQPKTQQSKQNKQQPKQAKQSPKQNQQQQPKPNQTKQSANKSNKQKPKNNNNQQSKKDSQQQGKRNKQQPNGPKSVPVPKPKVPAQPVPAAATLKKKHTFRNVVLSLFGMILLGSVGVYGYFAYYYYDKFIPGTVINQIDSHDMNAKQVEAQISERVEDYVIEIEFRGGEKERITGEAIDYAFVSDGSAQKILEEQNSLMWIAGYFNEYIHDVPESITFDDDKLKKEYSALKETRRENQEGPKNAYVFYQDQKWEIVPEVEGTTVDNSILYPVLAEAIHASARECSAEEANAYMEPAVREDDKNLVAEARELNELVRASITYELPQGDEVLDGNVLRQWLQRDARGRYIKDEEAFNEHITAYVAQLAEATNTFGKPKLFKMTGGGEVSVEGGAYGWEIDQEAERIKLQEELAANAKAKREPEYSKREFSKENNGFGDTYIEVNLTEQYMYVYRNGRLLLESDIVSGRMTRRRWTPPGIFTLTGKQKNKVLRGPLQPDGSYEWESPVSYWMPFNRGIGFHDATWNPSFGGTRYIYSGSHGCINMPYKNAQALYDIIDKEFLIVCFYSEEYTVR